jgi:hypothetical protein
MTRFTGTRRRKSPTVKRADAKELWFTSRRLGRCSWGLIPLALLGIVFAYVVTRPVRTDVCASEVLTNGRGVTVNLAAKTLKLETQEQAVPLERISDRSAVVIDTLSRLCRERQKGNLTGEEYQHRFNQVIEPVLASVAPKVPTFKADICMTSYCSNADFIKFLTDHDGDVVRINSMFDFSQANSLPFVDQCVATDARGNYPPHLSPFNAELPLPEWEDGKAPPNESLCGVYSLEMQSKAKSVWSSGGTGTTTYRINSFFRVNRQISGEKVTFYLQEMPASAGDFAG